MKILFLKSHLWTIFGKHYWLPAESSKSFIIKTSMIILPNILDRFFIRRFVLSRSNELFITLPSLFEFVTVFSTLSFNIKSSKKTSEKLNDCEKIG